MIRSLLLTAALFGAGSVVVAQTGAPAPSPAAAPASPAAPSPSPVVKTQLVFEKTAVDFGKIKEGETAKVSFAVRNPTDKPIGITQVRPGCGCTAADNNPKSIGPGESSTINVQFNSKGRPGRTHKTVSVFTDEAGPTNAYGAEYKLSFEGLVTTEFQFQPMSLNFATVDAGTEATKRASLIYTGEKPLKIVKVTSQDARITGRLVEEKPYAGESGKGTEFMFEATVPKDFPPTTFYTNLVIETDATESKTQMLPIQGRVEFEIAPAPNRVFAALTKGGSMTRSVALTSRKGKAFEVVEIKPNPNIPVTVKEASGNTPLEKRLEFAFTAGSDAKTIQDSVTVVVKQEGGEPFAIQIPVTLVIRDLSPQQSGPQGGILPGTGTQTKPAGTPAAKP